MPRKRNPNQAAPRGSTQSPESSQGAKKAWYTLRIEDLESRLKSQDALETQIADLQSQLAAKDLAVNARLEGGAAEIETLSGIGWGLAFAEYWRRTKQFDMVAPHALRSKSDQLGNRWSVQSLPVIREGLNPDQIATFVELGQVMGYDPYNPPTDEAFLLHCQPDKGLYDIACSDIEKQQQIHYKAQRDLAQAQAAKDSAIERKRMDLVPALNNQIDAINEVLKESSRKFNEDKAVIENAIQRYYVIWIENFARFDQYGMPLQCHKATVLPQKRHENLPKYEGPREAVVPPQVG